MTPEERYRMSLAKRFNEQGEGVQDFSGGVQPGVGREAIDDAVKSGAADRQGSQISSAGGNEAPASGSGAASAAAQMVGSGGQGGGGLSMAGDGLMAAGSIPSPASPYLLAAGLATKVVASGEANKRAKQEQQRTEYNARIQRRQALLSQLASQGTGL